MSIFSSLDKVERKYSDRDLFAKYVARLAPFKKELVTISVLIIVSIALSIITPLVASEAIDELITQNPDMDYVWIIAIIYSILIILVWFISYFRQIVNGWFTPYYLENLRMDIFDKLQDQDMGFFDRNNRGELNTRVTSDSSEFGSMTLIFSDFIANLLISIGVFSFLIWFDPALALVVSIGCVIILVSVFLFRKLLRKVSKNFREMVGDVTQYFISV